MARILFVVPPLAGHVNPTVAVGAELARRGHVVAWSGPPVVRPLLPPGAGLFVAGEAIDDAMVGAVRHRTAGMRGAAALKFLWEDFLVPLARATVADVADAIVSLRPDVVVSDQQTVAGALEARRAGVTWVTSATTPAELVGPFEALPKVGAWVRQQLVDLQVSCGVPVEDAARGDLRFSDELVIAFTTAELVGVPVHAPSPVAFVGPAIGGRPDGPDFPWEQLGPHPRVMVSLGTVNDAAGSRFYAAACEALGALGGSHVLVAPPDDVAASTGMPPANVVVRPRVPQLALLEHLDAVVTHGGNNTVCEALAHGIPLVVAPIRDDQGIIAEEVVRAGAGVRVRFGRIRPAELHAALAAVLEVPTYRDAAKRLAGSFARAGGAVAAADLLEAVAAKAHGAPLAQEG